MFADPLTAKLGAFVRGAGCDAAIARVRLRDAD
jgi:hypothetical protein